MGYKISILKGRLKGGLPPLLGQQVGGGQNLLKGTQVSQRADTRGMGQIF